LRFYLDNVTEAANLSAAFVLNKEAMGILPYEKINELVLKMEPKNRIDVISGTKQDWGRRLSCGQMVASKRIGISTNELPQQASRRSPGSSGTGEFKPSMAILLPSSPWRDTYRPVTANRT
jgi:hypothetical protein